MKKLFGICLFWLALVAFFYAPTPTPTLPSAQSTDFQEITPFAKVTFLDKPLTSNMP